MTIKEILKVLNQSRAYTQLKLYMNHTCITTCTRQRRKDMAHVQGKFENLAVHCGDKNNKNIQVWIVSVRVTVSANVQCH